MYALSQGVSQDPTPPTFDRPCQPTPVKVLVGCLVSFHSFPDRRACGFKIATAPIAGRLPWRLFRFCRLFQTRSPLFVGRAQ